MQAALSSRLSLAAEGGNADAQTSHGVLYDGWPYRIAGRRDAVVGIVPFGIKRRYQGTCGLRTERHASASCIAGQDPRRCLKDDGRSGTLAPTGRRTGNPGRSGEPRWPARIRGEGWVKATCASGLHGTADPLKQRHPSLRGQNGLGYLYELGRSVRDFVDEARAMVPQSRLTRHTPCGRATNLPASMYDQGASECERNARKSVRSNRGGFLPSSWHAQGRCNLGLMYR